MIKYATTAALLASLLSCGGALATESAAVQAVGVETLDAGIGVDATAADQDQHVCPTRTGTRIHHRHHSATCGFGRSYSGAELRRTGANDVARGLQLLDPAIIVHY